MPAILAQPPVPITSAHAGPKNRPSVRLAATHTDRQTVGGDAAEEECVDEQRSEYLLLHCTVRYGAVLWERSPRLT